MCDFFNDLKCPECDGYDLRWYSGLKNNGGAQDGRIKMHEVSSIFYLGCHFCSKTIRIVDGDKVAEFLTKMQERKDWE